jgi:hypothetical protein
MNISFRNLLLGFLILFPVIEALPLRKVRDYLGDIWEEYFDETTQHFYYHNPVLGSTSWILEFAPSRDGTLGAVGNPNRELVRRSRKNAFTKSSNPWDSTSDSFLDEPSTTHKTVSYVGKLPLYPRDRATLHLLNDPAGELRKKHIFTVFDVLRGVKARTNFPIALKAPVAFHHMFVSENSGMSSVAAERLRIEALTVADPESGEAWESLGHIWRVGEKPTQLPGDDPTMHPVHDIYCDCWLCRCTEMWSAL